MSEINRTSLLTGWKKDPYDRRDHLRRPRLDLPSPVDHGHLLPEVRDQGNVGACVGFGIGANLAALAKKLWVFSEWYSPTWIYNGARFLEGTLPNDVGCYPRSALEWLTDKGALLEKFWPYNPGALDRRTPPSSLEPEAAKHPVLGYQRVVGGAMGIASALADGNLVSIGTPWYSKWMNPGRDGVLLPISVNDRPDGGHETVLYGYDLAREVFFGMNSWGNEWGANGRFLMPFQAFSVFTSHGGYDAHVIEVEWAPGPDPDPEPAKKKFPWVFIVAGLVVAAALWLVLR